MPLLALPFLLLNLPPAISSSALARGRYITSSSTFSTTDHKPVKVEWLEGAEKERAIHETLEMREYKRVAEKLGKMGYRPVPEDAVAVRFVKETDGELAELFAVGVPFSGDPKKPAFIVALLKPVREALAFQLGAKSEILKPVAKEPAGRASLLLPTALAGGAHASFPASSSQCRLPAESAKLLTDNAQAGALHVSPNAVAAYADHFAEASLHASSASRYGVPSAW